MNIAIMGAGNIARTMATTLQPLKDVTCYAVASRDIKRARVFADKFGFMKAYGSYSDMLEDPNVDLVYIATPHSHHYEHIRMCLKHNKHVLCEKAFCANAKQAEEVMLLAEAKGLLLTEAMWTRYMPMRNTINSVIKSGIIGKPTSLSANLGYPLEHVERLVKPELCGGALLDLGVYVLNFASMVFGDEIEGLSANCVMHESGVDAQETIMLSYADGKMASLYVTMLAQTDRRGMINGTNGYIEIENINNYESITVYNLDRKIIAQYAAPYQVTGYEYEVQSAIEAIRDGRIECPEMTHADTLRMMQLMDSIRGAWGIEFPYEVEKVEADPELDEENSEIDSKNRKEKEANIDATDKSKESVSLKSEHEVVRIKPTKPVIEPGVKPKEKTSDEKRKRENEKPPIELPDYLKRHIKDMRGESDADEEEYPGEEEIENAEDNFANENDVDLEDEILEDEESSDESDSETIEEDDEYSDEEYVDEEYSEDDYAEDGEYYDEGEYSEEYYDDEQYDDGYYEDDQYEEDDESKKRGFFSKKIGFRKKMVGRR